MKWTQDEKERIFAQWDKKDPEQEERAELFGDVLIWILGIAVIVLIWI